jgi:hypothetical protein
MKNIFMFRFWQKSEYQKKCGEKRWFSENILNSLIRRLNQARKTSHTNIQWRLLSAIRIRHFVAKDLLGLKLIQFNYSITGEADTSRPSTCYENVER